MKKPLFKTVEIIESSDYVFSSIQVDVAKFMAQYYVCSLGDALSLFHPFSKFQEEKQEKLLTKFSTSIELSLEQKDVFEKIMEHKQALLFGDTGSGKTEVYMKYFEKMVQEGKRSILLMPEISLTPQMQMRLEKHFPSKVLVWHSKLTPKKRAETLEKILSQEAYIIAGPRSTLFLPIHNLGLIVVDEEHDESYKSSSKPRYNARDIALYMGKVHKIPVVLGSATPSLSSYVKFPSQRLKGTYHSAKRRYVYEREFEVLSEKILNAIEKNMQKKEQTVLFLPTRANFKYLICKECSKSCECVFCSVSMSVHQKTNALKCHYCNYVQAIPKVCTECGSNQLVSSRLGTAEAREELQEYFKDANIFQFDKDTITTQKKLKQALKSMAKKEIDVLVGTQMISKGHDYPDVTLAIIMGIDNILNVADYKAREKALSTLLQVAGRSGRNKDSLVLIQTLNEDFFKHYIGDYEKFLQDEIVFREGLYPPFKKLCRLLFTHKNHSKARESMESMYAKILSHNLVEVVGHGACSIERVANKYRFEILLRSNKSTDFLKTIALCKTDLLQVDMDPVDFM